MRFPHAAGWQRGPQVTHNGGQYGMVAPDGKWLYYSVQSKGLWKMPADGGETTQVLAPASLLGEWQLRGDSAGHLCCG